jgi:hypothetical protein
VLGRHGTRAAAACHPRDLSRDLPQDVGSSALHGSATDCPTVERRLILAVRHPCRILFCVPTAHHASCMTSPTLRSIDSYLRRLRSHLKHHHNNLGGRKRSIPYIKRCYKWCYSLATQLFECFNTSFLCRLGAAIITEPPKD